MKNRQTDYGKGDFNRSDPKKFYKNFDKINWSTDFWGWKNKPFMNQEEEYHFVKFIEKTFDMPHELVKGSDNEWQKLYRDFINAN